MTSPRRTHSANSSKCPGLVTQAKPRRTTAQVKADAEAKAAAKLAKKKERDARIKEVAEFESEAMEIEDLMDATPRPNFASKCGTRGSHLTSEDLESSEVDGPNPDRHTYIPSDVDESDDESEDFTETIDATPVPARKKKSVAPAAASTKQTKQKATKKSDSRVGKQLTIITENPESDEEPLVSKSYDRKQGMVVEDSEINLRGHADVLETKRSKVLNGAEQEVKTKQWSKKESVREAIAAIQQGQRAATTDTNDGGMSEVVLKVSEKVVHEKNVSSKHFGDGPQWSKRGEAKRGVDEGGVKKDDQSVASGGPVKCPNQDMSQEDDAITYVTCILTL